MIWRQAASPFVRLTSGRDDVHYPPSFLVDDDPRSLSLPRLNEAGERPSPICSGRHPPKQMEFDHSPSGFRHGQLNLRSRDRHTHSFRQARFAGPMPDSNRPGQHDHYQEVPRQSHPDLLHNCSRQGFARSADARRRWAAPGRRVRRVRTPGDRGRREWPRRRS